jgi:uncharacterized protein involved in outer membrane biogenesis
VLRNPELYVERNAADQSNWSSQESPIAHAAVKQVAPQQRHETPLIGRLEIMDGHIGYIDQKRKLEPMVQARQRSRSTYARPTHLNAYTSCGRVRVTRAQDRARGD